MVVKVRRDKDFVRKLLRNLRQHENRGQSKSTTRFDNDGTGSDIVVSVSDILPSGCLRKAFYHRKQFPVQEQDPLAPFYIRGKAVERVIARLIASRLVDDGSQVRQQERHEKEGIVCFPDLIDNEKIIEIKDTSVGRRLVPADTQFKGYLVQVLYYMLITGKEKAVILINYSSKELIWHHKDGQGRSWFFRPVDAKGVGIECWQVQLSKDDYARELLWEQMLRRREVVVSAMRNDDVSILPRVRTQDRPFRCATCPFYQRCMNEDSEAEEARHMANDLSILDSSAMVEGWDSSKQEG